MSLLYKNKTLHCLQGLFQSFYYSTGFLISAYIYLNGRFYFKLLLIHFYFCLDVFLTCLLPD